jgi:hypothetical protein
MALHTNVLLSVHMDPQHSPSMLMNPPIMRNHREMYQPHYHIQKNPYGAMVAATANAIGISSLRPTPADQPGRTHASSVQLSKPKPRGLSVFSPTKMS